MNGMNADSLQRDALAEPCAEDAWIVFTPFANNIIYQVMPGYFLSFEAFVLFAQAPDEGN